MGRLLRMLQAARKRKSDDKRAVLVSVIDDQVTHLLDTMFDIMY